MGNPKSKVKNFRTQFQIPKIPNTIIKSLSKLKVAIVVEELTQLGGAEKVLDAVLEIFPQATIFTLVWDKEKTNHKYDKNKIITSFIQKLPFGIKKYKWYLTLMPKAVESFDLKKYNLILSITSALVKGIKTNKNQLHICYCNTPTRYLWLDSKEYLRNAPIPRILRPIMPIVLYFLRKWDLKASKKPNFYIANSVNVLKRIKKYYKRDSDIIIFPPVETDRFKISQNISDYFLLVSRIEPYKKVDLVVETFKKLKYNLKIAGSGSKKEKIALKAGPNITFLGRVSDDELPVLYNQAKALIFPQEEDFGIVPVEAMASGRPVIAFKRGGALETIKKGITGEFFYPQTKKALYHALLKFKFNRYDPGIIRQHSQKFSKTLFKKKLLEYIISKLRKEQKWS